MNREDIEFEIGLELPTNFENYDQTTKVQIIKYLKHLDTIERKAYTIGKTHLGSSFNVIKSNGFCKFIKDLHQ
jgi:hypothetical protein